VKKALTPQADYLARGVELLGDLIILKALGCQKNHFRPHNLKTGEYRVLG
jgi:hypothetical protein